MVGLFFLRRGGLLQVFGIQNAIPRRTRGGKRSRTDAASAAVKSKLEELLDFFLGKT